MTDPKLQTTADLAQQLRDVIPPAPHFLAMLEELERRAQGIWSYIDTAPEGGQILVWDNLHKLYEAARWDVELDSWVDTWGEIIDSPTHWTHLPDRPEGA